MLLQQAELTTPSLPLLTDHTRQFSSRLLYGESSQTEEDTDLPPASDQTQAPSLSISFPEVQNSLRLLLKVVQC